MHPLVLLADYVLAPPFCRTIPDPRTRIETMERDPGILTWGKVEAKEDQLARRHPLPCYQCYTIWRHHKVYRRLLTAVDILVIVHIAVILVQLGYQVLTQGFNLLGEN